MQGIRKERSGAAVQVGLCVRVRLGGGRRVNTNRDREAWAPWRTLAGWVGWKIARMVEKNWALIIEIER